jgi:hypothetical protein
VILDGAAAWVVALSACVLLIAGFVVRRSRSARHSRLLVGPLALAAGVLLVWLT